MAHDEGKDLETIAAGGGADIVPASVEVDVPKAAITQPTVTLHQIQLETFETLVYQHQQARAGFELVSILTKLRSGAGFTGYPRAQFDDPKLSTHLYTRLASAIGALFVDPLFELTEDGFGVIAILQPIVDAIFVLSEYGNSDHFMQLLADDPMERDPSKLNFTSEQAFAKAVLIWCLNSRVDIAFDGAFKNATRLLFPWWLGLVSRVGSIGPRSSERYEELIGLAPAFRAMELNGMTLGPASDASMHCSYAVRADKHQLKREISRLLKRNFGKKIGAGIAVANLVRRQAKRPLHGTEKPVIVFPLEWWTSFHAMYRCYAPVVDQLRPHFRCVGIGRPGAYDDIAVARSFDDFIPLAGNDQKLILQEIVDKIKAVDPDVIYYMSVGMAQWWTALSAVRVAPLQIMSLGHPASSMSTEMDYALVEEGLSLGKDVFSECILELPPNALRFERRIDEENAKLFDGPREAQNERQRTASWLTVRVAVPAMAAKLNYPFLQLLKRAHDTYGAIEYHFFPNLLGLGHLAMKKQLIDMFPNCVVHARADYGTYLSALAACDLHASPFPFGGTNSNLDSMQIGIPILALEGPREPHERYDAAMLRRAGLHDLIAGDADNYHELLVKCVNDPAFLNKQRCDASLVDTDALFYGELEPPAKDAFARAIMYVYNNHHKLKGRDKVRWGEYTSRLPIA